jgi:NAD(P)-dependent dehydrogenase (short-subunit alcohol dehydrogenase family)
MDPVGRPHAVLVGVGPGLGASLARVLVDAGYDLTLMARRAASTDPVVEEVTARGGRARAELVDISDLEALAAAVRRADDWRPITHLHHNASMHTGNLLAADAGTLCTSLAVNAMAAVVAVQAGLPGLTSTGGRVTWTGGGVALRPHPDYGVLAMGKAALRAAALALAPELAERGIDLRMMTITGVIRSGGPFDPDRIAQAFWAFAQEPTTDVERIFDGQP